MSIKTWQERWAPTPWNNQDSYMQSEITDLRTALAERKKDHSDAMSMANEYATKLATLRTAAQQAMEALNQMRQRWDTDLPIYWTDGHEKLITTLTAALESK